MHSKRGLSTLIVIIILLALVMVAVGAVWTVVSGIISKSTEDISSKNFAINTEIKSASVINDNVNVFIKRGSGKGNLTGVRFIFFDGTKSKTIDDKSGLGELEEKKFIFSLANDLGMESMEKVSIVPIYFSGGKEVVGSIADIYSFTQVGGGGGDGGEGEGGGVAVCGNGQCEASLGENSENCAQDCGIQSCTPTVTCVTLDYSCGNAIDNCGNDLVCPSCSSGEICLEHQCLVDLLVSGTVDSIWPGDAPRYFDSSQLPKDGTESDLVFKYVSLNDDVAKGCIQISDIQHVYEVGPPVYDKTHIRLERVVVMSGGNSFKVWRSPNCGGLIS